MGGESRDLGTMQEADGDGVLLVAAEVPLQGGDGVGVLEALERREPGGGELEEGEANSR